LIFRSVVDDFSQQWRLDGYCSRWAHFLAAITADAELVIIAGFRFLAVIGAADSLGMQRTDRGANFAVVAAFIIDKRTGGDPVF